MVDHLIRQTWGLSGALTAALLTLAVIVPAGAAASVADAGALSQLASVVPAPANGAVSAALSQVASASAAGVSGAVVPHLPPSVPVVAPPPPPLMPAGARPAPPPAPPVPLPAGVPGQAMTAPAQSAPQPDAAVRAALTQTISATTVLPDPALGGRTALHRITHPRAHRHAGSPTSASAASTRRVLTAHTTGARTWSPVSMLETSRRGVQPTAPARRAVSRTESGRAPHLAPPRSRPGSALTTSQLALPLSAALPPGGGEGSAAGAGGSAAGAAAAALLATVGLCILRALLPGLLGLGLAPARSAFLVSRLERPG